MEIDKYVNRLFEEWKQHGKIIASVDFDDTIAIYNAGFNNKEEIERTIKLVKDVYLVGAYIVIFTASNQDRYPEIQKYCEEIQLPINAINKNPIELPYGNHGKIYYNINLCDRSGLIQALDILETAMYKYVGWLKEKEYKQLNDVA